jgi:hypothetical protein
MAEMQDPVEPVQETSYQKGLALEHMFSDYLVNELGYNSTRIRAHVKSSINNRGINVDIIAKRGYALAVGFDIAGTIFGLLTLIFISYAVENNNMPVGIMAIPFFILSGGCFFLFSNKMIKHSWVECKNHLTPVTHAMVLKTISEYESHKFTKSNEYNFTRLYFVSSSGFIDNALKLASDKKIHCYIIKNGNFEKLSYL